ncbi:MAG: stage II sporulation protein P [Halanaerobiaceae bacterium]
MPGRLKLAAVILILMILILSGLNLSKFGSMETFSGRITYIINSLTPGNLFYRITRLRLRAPVTYLKREIPLMSQYTPEDLEDPTSTVYNAGESRSNENNVIRLEFDMRETSEEDSQKENPDTTRTNSPLVGIYHTHTSETYIDDARSQDDNGHVAPGEIGNIGQVGQFLADTLSREHNLRVIHTTKVHDKDYGRAYYNSRQTARDLVENNSDLDILLDIHRDGLKEGGEEGYSAVVDNQKIAQIMIVVTNGTFDFAHLDLEEHHREWQQNLDYARRLEAKMEEMYPGLLKRVEIRDTTYNQDLHPHALLLEIGDYRNTTGEAVRSARMLADVIAALD